MIVAAENARVRRRDMRYAIVSPLESAMAVILSPDPNDRELVIVDTTPTVADLDPAWDDQIVSWGMAQFAGQAGTLAVLLADLKEDPRSRASYLRWFVGNGIDVARGEYRWKDGKTRVGWHVVVTGDGETHRGNEGWSHIRTQPRLLGAFMLAGNDPAIQLGQVSFWRDSFLTRAIAKHVA